MKLVTIIFNTTRNVTLTEGLIQMLDQQDAANIFVFLVEEEEIEMLLEEIETEIQFQVLDILINNA